MHRPPLPPGNIPGTHFCWRLSRPQGHSAAWRIVSMKNSNGTIGNRTRDLLACSAVPQPTATPRAPISTGRLPHGRGDRGSLGSKLGLSFFLNKIYTKYSRLNKHWASYAPGVSGKPFSSSCCKYSLLLSDFKQNFNLPENFSDTFRRHIS